MLESISGQPFDWLTRQEHDDLSTNRTKLHRNLARVARALNAGGIAGPRRKSWGKTSVYQTLANEVYTGTVVWGRTSIRKLPPVRVEGARPAIVSREAFEAAQKALAERAPKVLHPRRMSSRYLLSGLARCGRCGKALVGQDAKGGKFAYYVCGTLLKKGPKTCSAKYLPAPKFEALVVDKVKESILTEDNLREMVRLVNEEMDSACSEYRGKLETVSGGIGDVNQRLERLYDALETGKVTIGDLSSRIGELWERQKQLNAAKWELEALLADRRLELADEKTVRRFIEGLRALLSESPLAERRSFIRGFVSEVKVTGDQVVLTYTLPVPPKELTVEAMPVPPIVRYGGRYCTVDRTKTFELAFNL